MKVLVIDDSALVRQALTMILGRAGDVDVAAVPDPLFAAPKIRRDPPDVILLDIEMPRLDGLTFLRNLMASPRPIPVVVCTSRVGRTDVVLQALEEGAVAVVEKPRLAIRELANEQSQRLLETVRGAAQARVRPRGRPADAVAPPASLTRVGTATGKLVVLGASAGGTEALRVILEVLPADAPGLVIVQHMPPVLTRAFAAHLDRLCRIEVKEAEDGEPVRPGRALVAPGNLHVVVRRSGAEYEVELVDGPAVSRHRPSVDVLFRSVAQAAGPNAVGVLLTGTGRDGAAGLRAMRELGAATIAQDEATSVVFDMPREAIELEAVDEIAPLERIPGLILDRASRGERS